MALLGIDLGGTKLALAVFDENGTMSLKEIVPLGDLTGQAVGRLMIRHARRIMEIVSEKGEAIHSVGISVPGIAYATGRVWAPNIAGWDDYPLLGEMQKACGPVPVSIDSDRACYILGETWQGNAKGCRNAIFLSVGTGIGAGILIDGKILRGSSDIAGCIGWMALERPYLQKFTSCGCFEYYASGDGVARTALELLESECDYAGPLSHISHNLLSAKDVFRAFHDGDTLALQVIHRCIEYWGMAVANLVSLFNPEKIILGGGVFGPATSLIPAIWVEATKWAQPVGMKEVIIEGSSLAGDAGVYGAGFLALNHLKSHQNA